MPDIISYLILTRPSQGFWEQEKRGIFSRGTGEPMQNFEGNRGTKTILGNRDLRKQIIDFWGTGEQANLFQGTREQVPPPLGGPH